MVATMAMDFSLAMDSRLRKMVLELTGKARIVLREASHCRAGKGSAYLEHLTRLG